MRRLKMGLALLAVFGWSYCCGTTVETLGGVETLRNLAMIAASGFGTILVLVSFSKD